MGKFQPGESGNPTGRPKGSKNTNVSELRIRITDFLSGKLTEKQMGVIIDSLKPKDKLYAMLKLLEFALPKLRSVESTFDLDSLNEDQIQELYNRIASTKKSFINIDQLSREDRESWYKLMEKATIPESLN